MTFERRLEGGEGMSPADLERVPGERRGACQAVMFSSAGMRGGRGETQAEGGG